MHIYIYIYIYICNVRSFTFSRRRLFRRGDATFQDSTVSVKGFTLYVEIVYLLHRTFEQRTL